MCGIIPHKAITIPRKLYYLTCEYCKNTFPTEDKRRKFCNTKCFRKWIIGKPSKNKGRKKTKEQLIKMSMAQTGELVFTGFRRTLGMKIRNILQYSDWRLNVFKRDNYTCQYCNKRGGYLEAHHLKRFSIILKENKVTTLEQAKVCEELWFVSNGITLCLECHKKEH